MEHNVSNNVCDELDFNSQCPNSSSNDNIPKNTINVEEEPDPINLLFLENKSEETKIGFSIFRCEICFEETFEDENLLREHLKSHPYQHTCYECDEKFKITLDYIEHLQTHDKHTPYHCTLCTFTTRILSKMSSHLQARHQQFKKYKCDICYSRFHVSTHYIEHLSFHSGEKPFKCKICSKTFTFSRDMNSHAQLKHVTGNFECPNCKEEFEFKGDLVQHIKKHKRKPYLCQVCGNVLSGLDKLKNHFRRHTGDKPYNCKFCEKSFPTSTRLKEHENIHKRIKPYKCNQCEKSFSQPTPLKTHIRSQHTRERPFKCGNCGKGFVAQNLLNHHKKSCCIKLYNATVRSKRKISQKKYHMNEKQSCLENPKSNANLAIDQNQLNDPDLMNTQNSHFPRNRNDETDTTPLQNNNGESSSYVVPSDLFDTWYTYYTTKQLTITN